MNRGMYNGLRILAVLISLAWIAWAGWQQFAALPEEAVQHHGSDVVKDRMKDCEGSFKQRYECKEAIVIQSGRDTFNNMMMRLAIVFGPPALLGILFAFAVPKPRVTLPEAAKEKTDEWKTRVQPGHRPSVSVRVPPQPPSQTEREEPTFEPPPPPPPAPSSGGSDWKKKAQQHMKE